MKLIGWSIPQQFLILGTIVLVMHVVVDLPKSVKIGFDSHFEKLQTVVESLFGSLILNKDSFELTVLVGDSSLVLFPNFLNQSNGIYCYSTKLTQETIRFICWRPSQPIAIKAFQDKVDFKNILIRANIYTPEYQLYIDSPMNNVIVKGREGSFSKGIFGPFRCSDQYRLHPEMGQFLESFIDGKIVKLFFVNELPVLAFYREHVAVIGDGVSSLEQLIGQKLGCRKEDIPSKPYYFQVKQVLDYAGVSLFDVLKKGREQIIDIRFDTGYEVPRKTITRRYDELPHFQQTQLNHIGDVSYGLIKEEGVNLLCYSVDAIESEDNVYWILEANSNTWIHPDVYECLIKTQLLNPRKPT